MVYTLVAIITDRSFFYLLVLGAAFLLMLDGTLLFVFGDEVCGAFVLKDCVASLDCLRLALFILLQGKKKQQWHHHHQS